MLAPNPIITFIREAELRYADISEALSAVSLGYVCVRVTRRDARFRSY